MTDQIKRDAAFEALKFIYPDLNVARAQITPKAAAFAFKVIVKVDQGTRFSAGLFALNRVYTSWSSIPIAFAQALREMLQKPEGPVKNAVAIAYIAKPYQRLLQQHLQSPDTMECPDFKD